MSETLIIYMQKHSKEIVLPLTSVIGRDRRIYELESITRVFEEITGKKLAEKLDSAFKEALKDEILQVLNTERLGDEFPELASKFWFRIVFPLIEINEKSVPSRCFRTGKRSGG